MRMAREEFMKPERNRYEFAAGVCPGFLGGYLGGLKTEAIYQGFLKGDVRSAKVESACVPEDTTLRDLARDLVAFVKDRSDFEVKDDRETISAMLTSKYRCGRADKAAWPSQK